MIRAVLFDLDGTLLDTAADLVAALNHVRVAEGLEPVEVAAHRHRVSRGAQGLIEGGMPRASDEVMAARKQRFLEHYSQHGTRHSVPFEGIGNLLEELARRGVPWGVVTNKLERLTLPLIGAFAEFRNAACVICGDTLAQSKPHPAPVRLACEILRAEPARTLMVGDDLRDIQAGQAAGTATVLAAYGYVDPEVDPASLANTPSIDRPLDLLRLIDEANRSAVPGGVSA